eukprot:723237-Rhodomonas_salina.4
MHFCARGVEQACERGGLRGAQLHAQLRGSRSVGRRLTSVHKDGREKNAVIFSPAYLVMP